VKKQAIRFSYIGIVSSYFVSMNPGDTFLAGGTRKKNVPSNNTSKAFTTIVK